MSLLVLIDEILGISLNSTYSGQLLPITTQSLRTVRVLLATAVPQFSHHRINFGLENFSQLKKININIQKSECMKIIICNFENLCDKTEYIFYLGAVFVNPRSLSVVNPSILEHEPDVINKFPRIFVCTKIKLSFNCTHIHWFLNDIKIVWGSTGMRNACAASGS